MLKGKVSLITGGGRGIGAEIALTLAKAGSDIVIWDIDEATMRSTAGEIEKAGVKAIYQQVDVTDLSQVQAALKNTLDKTQNIDILINNAGITRDGLLMRMSEADWDAVLNVNLKGAFNCTKALCRQMLKQKAGVIINMSSIIGIMGNAGQANYAASKAGLIGLTKSAAKELGSKGIRVNAIAPGYIKTKMTDKLSDEVKEAMLKMIPLGELGEPEDVAELVLFLASDKSSYITGQVIQVDGGMRI